MFITNYLKLDWSPEQICGWFDKKLDFELHHETIYRFTHKDKINGDKLYKHLRRKCKSYKKRYADGKKGTGIPNRNDISQLPAYVETREFVGDWEGEAIIKSLKPFFGLNNIDASKVAVLHL